MPLAVAGAPSRFLHPSAKAVAAHPWMRTDTYAVGRAAAAGPGAETITAGGNLAAAMSTGDILMAGLGTATSVCDGDVVGFGHPMVFVGSGVPGQVTVRLDDLATGDGGLPPTEGLRWLLDDDSRVIVRPSGTEPKIKVYLEVIEPVAGTSDLPRARAAAADRLARVRAAVAQDGGDIVYRGFDKGKVYLQMQGACSGCPSSSATLKNGIEQLLRHYVPEVTEVRAV